MRSDLLIDRSNARLTVLERHPRVGAMLEVASGYLYIAPALAMFALFVAYPVGFAGWLSFHQWDGLTSIGSAPSVGAANYRALWGDPIFRESARHTALFAIATTMVQCSLAFILAFTIWYFRPRLAALLRSLFFFPCVLSMVVVGLAWRELLSSGGPVDSLVHIAGFGPVDWLGQSNLVMWVLVFVASWQWTGWTMILLLAGMTGISSELVEAAHLDGASSFALARRVVLPLISPVMSLAVLLNIIGGFQVFDTIYVMTGGGPDHASEVLGSYAYWIAFSAGGTGQLGYAAALAVVMVAVLSLFSYLRIRIAHLV